MPIYEYRCLKNGHQFEAVQRFSDEPLKECEICKGPVEKLISAAAFHLKGGGWYTTDYKNPSSGGSSGSQKPKDSEVSAPQKDDGKSGGGTENAVVKATTSSGEAGGK